MPYIQQHRRETLLRKPTLAATPGELNFVITTIINHYLDVVAGTGSVPSSTPAGYERYNAVIGALECAKLELYRRRIAPYEDKKIAENGDVY